MQSVAADKPVWPLYLPVGHTVGAAVTSGQYFPAGQIKHADAGPWAVSVWYVAPPNQLVGHVMQRVWPVTGWYVPIGHAVCTAVPPKEKYPAAANAWVGLVELAAHKAPGAHTPEQNSVDSPATAPYVPAGQAICAGAMAGQYLPATHCVGAATLAAQ